MFELLRRLRVVCKGAADVGEHLGGCQRVRPHPGVVEQFLQRLALMIVCHRRTQGPPEPLMAPILMHILSSNTDK